MKIQDIKSRVAIEDVLGEYVELKPAGGPKLKGLCPFHHERTPSFVVYTDSQRFKCYGCDAGGDVVDFFTLQGHSLQEAKDLLTAGQASAEFAKRAPFKAARKKQPWKPTAPSQQLPLPLFRHWLYGEPSGVWAYQNERGIYISYVCRFDLPEGGKETWPLTFCTNSETGEQDWRWLAQDAPRKLYNLPALEQAPLVLVVEGEKTAEAAKKLFPGLAVTTWPGGGKATHKSDFSPLHGKKVILWPDHDAEGYETMRKLADTLAPHCPSVRMVRNPQDAPKGWDVADANWTETEAQSYLKANLFEAAQPETATQPSQPAPQQPQAPQPKAQTHKDEGFFAPLGIEKADGTTYLVFFSHRMGVITRLSPSSLTTNNLLTLAPLNWWESRFPSSSKQSKFDTAAAADFLYEACSVRGFFDPLLTRGRGAWEDRGRIVINTGQNLIVDGQAMDFRDLETKYVYEAGLPLDIHTQNPMQAQESTLLYDACKLAFWEREVNAGLLAGWVAIAPICGAFNWRPHIWMTGPAGSGKSSLWKNLVMKVLAEVAIHAQGETTLPGLRNALGIDGRPVVFDEFEITDKNSQERAQQLLGFARACSSDGSGLIYKGASNGTTRQYQPRAAFALASIGLGLIEQSDRRRFTVLQTKKVARTEETKRRLNLQADLCLQFDKDYRRRLQARIISMLPTILHNTEVFGDVASAKLGGAAYGDQLGPMLAGWAALLSDKKYSIEEAKEFILGHDWGMEEELADTRDEVACLNYLMQCSVEVDGEFGRVRRTIGELIQTVQGKGDLGVSMANADARLKRAGMRVDTVLDDFHNPNWFLIVANTSKEVKDLLRGKETWANNHAQILKRLDGADTTGQPIRFGSVKARGVIIPLPEDED